MKYIDTENLKSLIKERYNTYKIGQHSPFRNGKVEALREIIELIGSLQQEQINVDLEKELNDYGYHYDYVSLADRKELMNFAKYFFELGLKAQKRE